MKIKGYQARVEFDEQDEIFIGRIIGINDVVGFHADSVEALKVAFEEAVNDYLETCHQVGKQPEKAYSGKLMLRIDPKAHAMAAQNAEKAGKSMNQWAEDLILGQGA